MTEPAAGPRRAAFAFVFVTVLLDMLALGMVVPVLPRLIESMLGGDTERAAKMLGLFATVWALMQFLSMPVMGGLSDRYGRRPVILISNLGLGFDYVLMALAPNLRWLFLGRVLSGVTAASISTAMAYIADVSPPEKRAARYGMIGIAFGVGFIVGPAAGGLLATVDPRLPFWAAAAASLANAAYGYFVLPESLPPERRRAFDWRRANPVGSLGFLRRHHEVAGLATASFLSNVAHAVLSTVFVLYTGYRYGWHEGNVGLALAGIGASSALVQGVLVGPLVRRFGERRVLLAGLLCGAFGFCTYAVAPSGPWFLAGIPIVALWGVVGPAAQGLLSRHVEPNQQGELQGAMGSVQGIATMVGPGLFAGTFAWSIRNDATWHFPGAAWVLAGLLLAGAAIIAARATRVRAAA